MRHKRLNQFVFLAILLLYSISFVTNFSVGMAVLGLPLLLYFPGMFLIGLIPALGSLTGYFGKMSLNVVYSFCLSSVIGIYTQNLFGFNSINQIWAIIITNTLIFLAYFLLPKSKYWNKIVPQKQPGKHSKQGLQNFLPIIILASACAVWILISPLAQNADNFLGLLRQSANQNFNLLTTRRIFISFLWLATKFSSINDIIIYRFFPVAFFLATSLSLYDYIKRNYQSQRLSFFIYLTFLAPAVILSEVNNIRPQVILLALVIPVLILQIDSLKNKNIFTSLIALSIACVSALFHELGFILLFISVITTIIHLLRLIFVEKKITWKHILLSLIIIYPYIKMLDLTVFIGPIKVIKGYVLEILSRDQIHLRWWFLNHYIDADGVTISFTGKNLILYYLYNGILPLILFVYLLFVLLIKKIKLGLHFVPPLLYFLFFFLAAEIFPRFTLTYLPSRAWVHIMMATVLLLTLALEKILKKGIKIKLLSYLMISIILIGFSGSLFVAKTNIKEVYSEELPAANFIKNNLSSDSLILSTQYNIGLVAVYGHQTNYDQMPVNSLVDKDMFEKMISKKEEELSQDKIIPIRPKIIQTLDSYIGSQLIDSKVTVFQQEQNKVTKAIYSAGKPIYFIYSYRKLDALNTANQNRQDSADPINRDTYPNLGYEIVYHDKNVLIMKLK